MKRRISAGTLLLAGLLAAAWPGFAHAQTGLGFNGTNQHVAFGSAPSLNVSSFTIECWFMRTGTGVTASTGTGGWAAIVPLVTKGRGEAESPANLNMNWFLGIRSDGVLCADFEEAAGPNRPIGGTRAIPQNLWHHAAVSYDVATGQYRLYLNGVLEKDTTLTPGTAPAATSIQHAALATAMTSSGATQGWFNGRLDEVRIWNVARTAGEIAADRFAPLAAGAGLIARWGLDEGTGATAANSVAGAANGTLVNGPAWTAGTPFQHAYALGFSGASGNYVSFGANSALGLPQFTVECWFRRDAAGSTANTGAGGVLAVPLVTKGGAEADGSVVDMNWFLGIRGSDDVLVADFEEGAGGASPGLNHPVAGTTPIPAGSGWHHAAATYDGATWTLYLDGNVEATLFVGQPVQSASTQHAGLGASLTSTGAASGAFAGALDEVRVWNTARSGAAIVADINAQLGAPAASLVARWGMSEGAGAAIASTAGTPVNGAINGSGVTWIEGAPFDLVVTPPGPPADPTDLAVTPLAFNAIGIAWTDAAVNEISYEIERSTTGAGGPFAALASLPAGSAAYTDEPLAGGAEYCYRVRAVNGFGPSNWTAVECATTPAEQSLAFDFPGSSAYVTFGPAPALNLAQFTIECWFRRDGAGATTSTGTGGATSAVPLVAKGRGEAENAGVDLNWFLGIDATTGVLVADFEEGAGGAAPSLNHPVFGVTPIPADGVWRHGAAAYDGATWTLYLDGCVEATLAVGQPPAAATTQHASIGSALNSTGVAQGSFDGAIDAVKVWSAALTAAELQTSLAGPGGGAGLAGEWRLNDEIGTTVYAATGPDGNLVGAVARVPGAPFADPLAPSVAVTAPNGGETLIIGESAVITWNAADCFGVLDVDLEISRSGPGGPWEVIAAAIANSGAYAWTVTGPAVSVDAWLRVTARDAAGNTAADLSDGGFAIEEGPTPTRIALFSLLPGAAGNTVTWQFTTPDEVASSRLDRAEAAAGPWAAVNAAVARDGARRTVLDADVVPGRTYWYRLEAVTADGATLRFGPISGTAEKVTEFAFAALAPNPTRGALTASFALPADAHVRLRIVDVQGRVVATLHDGLLPAGTLRLAWNGESTHGPLGAGVYFAIAELGGKRFVRRAVVAR